MSSEKPIEEDQTMEGYRPFGGSDRLEPLRVLVMGGVCGRPSLPTARSTEIEEGASQEQPLEHSGTCVARQVWETGTIPVVAPDPSDLLAYDYVFSFEEPGISVNPWGLMEVSWFFLSSGKDLGEATTVWGPCGSARGEAPAHGAQDTGMRPPLGPASGQGSPGPLSSELLLPQSSPGTVVEPTAQGGPSSSRPTLCHCSRCRPPPKRCSHCRHLCSRPKHHSRCGSPPLRM